MALTESDIKIIIAGELKKKGFKDAEKATNSLEKKFKQLGKTVVTVFAAREIYRFGKASVKAFAEEDKAVKNLTQSLNNLGLGYNVTAIEDYVSATQAATGISDSQLRPALVELIQVTMDAEKSISLLNAAMDLSAGTGVSLDSAVTALTRAYNGNYTSLGKLQRVYTKAELEALGFEKSVSALNDAFGGTAAANANSYQGKIDRLNVAFDEAKETIGKGIITAFERLADGDFDKVLNAIAWSAEKLSGFMNNIAFSIQYTKALLKTGWTIGKEEQAQLDMIRQQWTNPTDKSNTAAANRMFLRDMQKQLALQKKIAAERAKAAKLAAAEKKNQEALAKAKSVFDLEKIQIQAALQGKITEEERTRLLLMKAIVEENGDEATKLMEKLKDLQNETIKLATMLTEFPKANDPFEDWFESLDSIKDRFNSIIALTSKAGESAMALGDAYAALAGAQGRQAEAILTLEAATKAIGTAKTAAELAAALAAEAAAKAFIDAAALEAGSAADLLTVTEGGVLDGSMTSSTDTSTTINITVEGSVISEQDLASLVTDYQYNFQRTGGSTLLSSRAL